MISVNDGDCATCGFGNSHDNASSSFATRLGGCLVGLCFRRFTKAPSYAVHYGGQIKAKMGNKAGNSRPLWNNSSDASAALSSSEAVNLMLVFIHKRLLQSPWK